MNGPQIASIESCTGCSACMAVCPKNAIAMHPDSEGFMRPKVDNALCIGCHLCEKTCPVLHPGNPDEHPACYAALTKDDALRMKSSSGGIFSELAKSILASGGVVFGCVLEKPELVAIHKGVDAEEGLAELRGSKYVQSDVRNTFREAKIALDAGRQVLYSGTPCQIAGLNAFLRKPYEKLLTVEVLCHGAPSPAVFEEYKKRLVRKFRKTPVSIVFRNKYYSWRRCSLVSAFADTSENREDLYSNPYIRAFLLDFTLRPSCYQCAARAAKSGADITIGDFWGIEDVCPELDDNRGISAVMIHTNRGHNVWNKCRPNLICKTVTDGAIIRSNPAYVRSVELKPGRQDFMRRYHQGSWERLIPYCVHGYWPLWMLRRVVRKVIRIIKMG